MFFLLPALAVVAEAATAVTVGTLSAGTTTTGLNLKVREGAKDVAIVIGK